MRDKKGKFIKGHKSCKYWLGKSRPNLFSSSSIKKMKESHKGEKAYNYKGGKVGYFGLHSWVTRWKGSPKFCEICKSKDEKKYEWANISKKYKRKLEDYIRLCKRCHIRYDNVLEKVWKTRRKLLVIKDGKSLLKCMIK